MSRIWMGVRVVTALGIVAAALAFPIVAYAHEKVDSGNYHFEIGWLYEPVVPGERNGLDLFVAPKDKPDAGLADISTLNFAVEYGGVTASYDITPVEDRPGHYQAVFVPAREGKYTFHITGEIQGQSVDVAVEPDEVQPISSLAFPPAGSTGESSPASATRSSMTLGIVGLGFGLLGTALAIVAVLRKPRGRS